MQSAGIPFDISDNVLDARLRAVEMGKCVTADFVAAPRQADHVPGIEHQSGMVLAAREPAGRKIRPPRPECLQRRRAIGGSRLGKVVKTDRQHAARRTAQRMAAAKRIASAPGYLGADAARGLIDPFAHGRASPYQLARQSFSAATRTSTGAGARTMRDRTGRQARWPGVRRSSFAQR